MIDYVMIGCVMTFCVRGCVRRVGSRVCYDRVYPEGCAAPLLVGLNRLISSRAWWSYSYPPHRSTR